MKSQTCTCPRRTTTSLYGLLKHALFALRRRIVLALWFWHVRYHLDPVTHLIDIGPGIRPQTRIPADHITLVEAFGPYATHLRSLGHDVVQMTGQDYADAYDLTGSTVVLCDVIEHLEKKDGQRLIGSLQMTAEAIVLYTPLGFMPQDSDPWGMGGDYWQLHRSGWTPADFPDWYTRVDPYFHGDQGMGAFLAIWRRAWAIKS